MGTWMVLQPKTLIISVLLSALFFLLACGTAATATPGTSSSTPAAVPAGQTQATAAPN
jgi:hypothetical protein